MEPKRTLRPRTRLPYYLLGLLLVLQLVQPDVVWTSALVGLGLTVGLSYMWARTLRDWVGVQRVSKGAWVVVGDTLTEQFTVYNQGLLPVLWATVCDASDIPGYAIDRAVAVGSGSSYAWQTTGTCTQRGVFTLGPWSVAMGDPFGLFDVKITYPEVRTLLVYPRAMHLPDIQLPRGSAGGNARRTQATHTETMLSSHVRPYVPGDALHIVHWRKTAQHQTLMVRQFDLEPAGDLWLLLDLDAAVQAGQGAESTVEYGVILVASLAAQHLSQNRAVGLVAFGTEPVLILPQSGKAQLWPILRSLAQATPGDDWPLTRVLRQIGPELGRGRTLLAITPSQDVDWVGEMLRLKRRDIAPAVLLLDRGSFIGQASSGMSTFCGLLADHTIPVHVIDKSYVFRPVAPIKRKRTVLKTLGGYGRVMAVEIEEEV